MTNLIPRSLEEAERRGWYAPRDAIVEKRIKGGKTKDFLGIVDVLVLDHEPGVHALQITSSSNMAARITKARGNEHLGAWFARGNRFSVWGWLYNAAGEWVLREAMLGPQDLVA